MLMSEAEQKAKMEELRAKKEHKAKMESNFVRFRYKSNKSTKRKRGNNKLPNCRNKKQNVHSEQSQQLPQQQQQQQYLQADEFDMLALVDKKLLPSEAFVPNQQDYLPNDSSLWSLEQWLNATNQIAPPVGLDFNILNQSPQCPMFPPVNHQSPTQNMFSPSNCSIEPFMTALSIKDPFANLFPPSNQVTNTTLPSANADPVVMPSINTDPTVLIPSNQVVQPVFNNTVVPSISTGSIFTNTTASSISTDQPSHQNTTLQESDMPSRPDPPKFKDGPRYVRASEDFIDYFREIDTDDSGTINFAELKGSLFNKGEHRHQNFCNQAVYILIEMFDKNNDGTIDKEEFPELLAYIRNWEQCFKFLDSDNSGTINYQEMHIAIQALGLRDFGGLCLSKLLYQYDPTGNLEIDFDNFILICVSVVRFNDTFKFMQKTFGPHGIRGLTLEDLITSCGKRMYHHHVINK